MKKKPSKLKKSYNEEEKRHDKAYEKENKKHEKRHRVELDEALEIGTQVPAARVPGKRKKK